ncbi:hypothetical protein [Chitinilyticum litopenaei]|uniref:hypothetical protein n=1 Tax=Chitinilyticum litopenaei TaxID=1121276 RepID=UPI00042059F6|nr:hypothetical protein [Chitinilyticum litopenaei]
MLSTMLTGAIFGASLGFLILLVTVLIAQGKKQRAIVTLESNGDLWPQIEAWCSQHGYALREQDEQRRLYQHGKGFWQAAGRFQASRNGNVWQLEGWLHMNAFITRAELALDETGPVAKVPRDKRKKEFNALLGQLGAAAL